MGVSISYLYSLGAGAATLKAYLATVTAVSLATIAALNIGAKDDLIWAYKFIKKFGECTVQCEKCKLSADELYGITRKLSKHKLSKVDTLEHYVDFIKQLCRKDLVYSYKIMTALGDLQSKSETEAESKQTVYVYHIVTKSGKKRLVLMSMAEEEIYTSQPAGATLDIE